VQALCLCVILAAGSVVFGSEAGTEIPEGGVLPFPTSVAPSNTPLDLGDKPSTEVVSKRLFGIIPNYKADQYQAKYTPISTAGKFAIARSDSFDWPNYFLLAGYALQSQVAEGGFKHSGGLNGFGRYYSRSVADQIIGSYITEAIMPTLFHEDPRFFRLGAGPIWYRAYNATTRVFVTRKDNGSTGFYYSELLGNIGVTAIGNIYYPNSRSFSEGAERYGMAIGNDMISNLLTEFWPDIKRRLPLLHKKA
jgi:hypothetical protein